jgi:CheY-like chemotaxis protein
MCSLLRGESVVMMSIARITASGRHVLVLTGALGLPLAGIHTAGCKVLNRPETGGGPTPGGWLNPGHGPSYVLGSGNAYRSPSCQAEVMMLRCLIVDDSSRFLNAARSLLERQGITVVGMASTSAEALEQAAELRPDVTLVDIDLGGESGLELARQLGGRSDVAPSSLILISAHAEQDYVDLIAASTAAGFLSKSDLSAGAIRDLLGPGAGDSLHPVSGPRGK